MKHHITYLINSTYCSLKPSDPDCHRHATIIADSKTEAIMQLHAQSGMQFELSSKRVYPVVWSVDSI